MALVHPSSSSFLSTTFSASSTGNDSITLPAGFPTSFPTHMAWTAQDLAGEEYVYELTRDDLAEIDDALRAFKAHGLNGDLATPSTFPLPRLSTTLRTLSDALHNGCGIALIRGLRPEMYSVEDAMVVFMGVQAYVAGMKGRQDGAGNMVVHITPLPYEKKHARHSMDSLPFHTEATGDILAWQTRSTAAEGGKCILASAYTAYNYLAATCPEVIRTLAAPDWPFAFPTPHTRPLIYHTASRLIINFSPTALLGSLSHPRPASLPRLSTAQLSALEALQAVARATEIEITTKAGDMHFVNNLGIMHRRSAFRGAGAGAGDGSGLVRKEGRLAGGVQRHLVRMCLRSEECGWAIPRELEGAWEEAFGEEGERLWHLYPMPGGYFPLRKYPE